MDSGPERGPALYHLPGFDEPFSAISHLLGAVVFLILGLMPLRSARLNWHGNMFWI